jgi:uncharacterized protein with FMN-binding domain
VASGRGKGRISNELVAASCAAVLAVYAAGYWRTREAARRIEAQAQERRLARIVASPGAAPAAVIQPPASEVPGVTGPAMPASERPKPSQTAPSKTRSAPVTAVTSKAAATALTATVEPASESPLETPSVPRTKWHDGTYTGWGTSPHGDIKAQVVIRDSRIVDASIASCETRYPCDVIGDIIRQPVARQSPEVDRVSRATESADAYYYGLVEALKDAQIPPEGLAPATP